LTKHGPEQQTILKCLRLNARSASKLTWADYLLVLIDTTNVKRNDEGKRRKRKNEGINRRKDTLIKKAYELGEFDSIDVALIICKHGRYITYRSRDYVSWPLSIAKIVSKAIACLKYTTGVNTHLANCLSSPKEYITRRHREAPFKICRGKAIALEE
jgi:hypothetical protein